MSPISHTLGQQSNNRIELLDPTHRGLHRFVYIERLGRCI